MVIFRAGVALPVPVEYGTEPGHMALVAILTSTSRYAEAVRVLDTHAVSWLAADVLLGVPWAQRYLNTTARLSQSKLPSDRRQAAAGLRALMHVLTGVPARTGRRPRAPLSPEELAQAASAIAKWRAVVDAKWVTDRATRASTLVAAVHRAGSLSVAQRRTLTNLLRRARVRRDDVVLLLASFDTSLTARRLRSARRTADLIYG